MRIILKVSQCTDSTLMRNLAVISGDSKETPDEYEMYMYIFIRNL